MARANTFVVVNTASAGPGSLADAIAQANGNPGPDIVTFNLPSYPGKITLAAQLPYVTDSLTIDATAPGGCVPGALPRIELDGGGLGPNANGIVADGSGIPITVTIKGVAIYSFSAAGILLVNNVNSVIVGDHIGTDATGFTPGLGNGTGIRLTACIGTQVGGTNACEGNLIVNSADAGIELVAPACQNNRVVGNHIGISAGTTLPNGTGVRVNNAGFNTIGGSDIASANTISANLGYGVEVTGSASWTVQNIVQGNYVGTDGSGTSPWPNLSGGVLLDTGATSNGILANVIAFNNGPGVFVHEGSENRIQQNSIYDNSQLGIDLQPLGPNGNDALDPDNGPNRSQNYPIISNAVASATSTHVAGLLNSEPGKNFTIDFYWSTACDRTGFGQGRKHFGRLQVTTDAAGDAPFNADFPAELPSTATVVTATATHQAGSTSEFSPCTPVAQGASGGFPITGLTLLESNRISIAYPSDENFYFILYRGTNVNNITLPVQMKLGVSGSDFMLDDVVAGSGARFYRMARISIAHPLDTDGDGIDDVYELKSGGGLNPLNPSDGLQDSDGDGESDLAEYKCGTDPKDPYNGLFPVKWSLATPWGIQIDSRSDIWHSGRVDDLAMIPGGVVAVSELGGAWLITANAGIVFPLSHDWDKPDLASITHGPDGPYHLFAAGAGLYETDVSQAFPLFNWREIPLPAGVAPVYQVLVAPYVRRVVLATQGGVIWSPIPSPGAPISQYHWKFAVGLPRAPFSGLALAPSDIIIAAAFGSGAGHYGIYNGYWSSDLVCTRSSISGLDPTGMYRTVLAWYPDTRLNMYALTVDSGGLLYGILRSTDAGYNWTRCNQFAGGQDLRNLLGGQGNDRDGFISVSAHNPNRIAVGMVSGPYVSTDGGSSWASVTPNSNSHADLTSLHFDPADSQDNTYWLTSDGGLVISKDFGNTLDFTYNRNLPNLECLGPYGAREWYGTLGIANVGGDTLTASGLQDNGNVVCRLNPTPGPWLWLGGGDGDLTAFITPGNLLQTHNADYGLTSAMWSSGSHTFGPVSYLPVRSGNTVVAPELVGAIVEPVVQPTHMNANGQLMWAVAANQNSLYGIFANNNGTDIHLEPLTSLPIIIRSVASFDGRFVYAGGPGGRVFQLNTAGSAAGEVIIPLYQWRNDTSYSTVASIATPSATEVFAAMDSGIADDGAIFRSVNGGITWDWVHSAGAPRETIWAMNVDATSTPTALFVALDNRVLVTFDDGNSWKNASAGLPARAHLSDLRLLTDPNDNKRYLYASTFGRSVWRTQLADYRKYGYGSTIPTRYSGNFIQGTFGQQGNFELLAAHDDLVFHYTRDNDAPGYPWHHAACLPPTATGKPGGVALIQSRFANPGYPGNMVAVVRIDVPNDPNRAQSWLAYYEYSSLTRVWSNPSQLSADGLPITGVTGDPALIQSSFGANGNYELLVPQGGHISHYWRDNDNPNQPWHHASDLPTASGGGFPGTALEVAFIQSKPVLTNAPPNFNAVVRMRPPTVSQPDYIAYYEFNGASLQWSGPVSLFADGLGINGVTGPPAVFQSSFGIQGDFLLLFPQGDHIAEFTRDNDTSGTPWHRNPDLPKAGGTGQSLTSTPVDVAFFQSNFRVNPSAPGNLEVTARFSPPLVSAPNYVGFYYFDSSAQKWNGVYSLSADGKAINGQTAY